MENEKNGGNTPSKKPTIFWIMPFQEKFKEVYDSFKEDLGSKYHFTNAEDTVNQGNILKDIILGIIDADFIIADVSPVETIKKFVPENASSSETTTEIVPFFNGNVMFELGVAMSYRKNIYLITNSKKEEFLFDIRPYRTHRYTDTRKQLGVFIREVDEVFSNLSVIYDNPVTDFDKKYDLVLKSELEQLRNDATNTQNESPKSEISKRLLSETDFDCVPYSKEILTLAYQRKSGISRGKFSRKTPGSGWVVFSGLKIGEEFFDPPNAAPIELDAAINFLLENNLIKEMAMEERSKNYRLTSLGIETAKSLC